MFAFLVGSLHYLLESKPKKLEYEVNALFRHMLFSSIFKEFCGYYLQQESLVVSLWMAAYCFDNSMGCLEASIDPYDQ